MANEDNPRGFWPTRHFKGGVVRMNTYLVTSGQTVYQGDVLKAVNGGTVEEADAGDDNIVVGVAAHYANDSASAGDVTVEVYDDPGIVFAVQFNSSYTSTASDVFAGADHLATVGTTAKDLSNHELKDATTGAQQCKILGLLKLPNNAWGEHAVVEILFAEHYWLGSGITNVPI